MGRFTTVVGVMGSGKSSRAILEIQKLRLNSLKVLVIKPKLDTRDGGFVSSRLIADKIPADLIIDAHEHLDSIWLRKEAFNYIVVDEFHMLQPHQIRELYQLTASSPTNVMLFGLKMSYLGAPFESASIALGYSDDIENIRMINRNEHEITHHIMYLDGIPVDITKNNGAIQTGDFEGRVSFKAVTKQEYYLTYNKGELLK